MADCMCGRLRHVSSSVWLGWGTVFHGFQKVVNLSASVVGGKLSRRPSVVQSHCVLFVLL